MGKLLFYLLLAAAVFVILAWNSDIKPRIFSNPNAVSLKPEFKLGLLIYSGCFFAALLLFVALQAIGPDSNPYRITTGICAICAALFAGKHFTTRSVRRLFFEESISMRMNPEDYAKTLCPPYVVQYIEAHLDDKADLEKYINYQRKIGHLSDACAWAFLVAYCNHRP